MPNTRKVLDKAIKAMDDGYALYFDKLDAPGVTLERASKIFKQAKSDPDISEIQLDRLENRFRTIYGVKPK